MSNSPEGFANKGAMKGNMRGWNFRPNTHTQKLSADGSTTLDNLRAEKTRLEGRLVEIPGLITKLNNSIQVLQDDINWLNGLNDRQRKNWEKNSGRDLKQAVYDGSNTLVGYKAQLQSLSDEKGRIPGQITEVDRQLAALVKGESAGLTKGLDKATAQQLGEIAVQKEQNQIAYESAVQKAELEKAATPPSKMTTQVKWLIVAGVAIVLAIIGYIIYKRRQAAGMPQPVVV